MLRSFRQGFSQWQLVLELTTEIQTDEGRPLVYKSVLKISPRNKSRFEDLTCVDILLSVLPLEMKVSKPLLNFRFMFGATLNDTFLNVQIHNQWTE